VPASAHREAALRVWNELATISCAGVGVECATFLPRVAKVPVGLNELGVNPGRIALLLRNSVAFVESALAVCRPGAFAVPIDWHFTAREIEALLDD
jgi:long-chain acyl-CoA synthetase